MEDQEVGVLMLISTPGGNLTYEDHDVVFCMEASKNPGNAVVANEGGHWSFVYITDKKCSEVISICSPHMDGEAEDAEMLAKRRYGCQLDAPRAAVCTTYNTFENAPLEQTMTWAEYESTYKTDKAV